MQKDFLLRDEKAGIKGFGSKIKGQVHQAQEEPVAQPAETELHMITITGTVFEGGYSKAHIKEKWGSGKIETDVVRIYR